MSTRKTGYVFFTILMLTTFRFPAPALAADELGGYTPPPMFGGATSTPKSAPVVETPAPTAAPVPAKEFHKITTPPADKETVLETEPLPIEPISARQPQKVTTPPADKESIPKYVPAPKPQPKKIEAKKETVIKSEPGLIIPPQNKVSLPIPEPVAPEPAIVMPAPKLQPAPEVKNIAPNIRAEDLLSHPITSESAIPDANPLAVPAAPVEDGLPLPGSVAPQPKVKAEKPKKEEKKKTESVKKETSKKKEEPKAEPKKAEKKKEVTPALPKAVPPVKAKVDPAKPVVKPEPKEEPVKKNEDQAKDKAFHLEGKKNMPTVKPTKVDRAELDKMPLPKIDAVPLVEAPTANEKIIDKSLQERLVEPDVKAIVAPDEKPAAKNTGSISAKKTPAPVAPEPKAVKPQLISLEFKKDLSDLQPDQKKIVSQDVLPKLKADPEGRLQILAYASVSKEGQSSARRVSLARGLSLRAYFLENGIDPSRIDIRALGENTNEKPLDRVDLLVVPSK